MNKLIPRSASFVFVVLVLALALAAQRAFAVEALLLQDTCVDYGTTGDSPPNQLNYGAGSDLRVFKGNGHVGRAFVQFSLDTLPPNTKAVDVISARLRLWVNRNTTAVGSISLKPVTTKWDEYTLTGTSAARLSAGLPPLGNLPIESLNTFISVDVTEWVKAWLDGALQNQGILIEPGTDIDFLDLCFDSKESDQTSHEARLEITLTSR